MSTSHAPAPKVKQHLRARLGALYACRARLRIGTRAGALRKPRTAWPAALRVQAAYADDPARVGRSACAQELKRGLNALTNFGMSFSIVSFLTSITGSFGIAWFWGALRSSFSQMRDSRVRARGCAALLPAITARVLPPACS